MNREKIKETLPAILEKQFSISFIREDGRITYANPLFCKLSMRCEDEITGHYIQESQIFSHVDDLLKDASRAVHNMKIVQKQVERIQQNGHRFWTQLTIIPLFHEREGHKQIITLELHPNHTQRNGNFAHTLNELKNLENALIQSSEIVMTDIHGKITYANERFCKLSQYAAEELIGQTHRIVRSGHHPKAFFENMWDTIKVGDIWIGDIKNRAKDGSYYWTNTTIIPFLNEKKEPYQFVAIRHDITDRKKAEEALQLAQENDFQKTVKNLHNAIFKYQKGEHGELVFTLLEGKLAKRLNIQLEDFMSGELYQSLTRNEIRKNQLILYDALEGIASDFEFNYLSYTFFISLSPIIENDVVKEVVGTISDITDRIEAEEKIKQMAYYDLLTNLPNQTLFSKKADEIIHIAKRYANNLAMMLINLDGFKYVNDSMGHTIGDEILKHVAVRIQEVVNENGIVGRLGGDEFIVLLANKTENESETIAKALIETLEKPFILQNNDVFINVSIGISSFPKDGDTCKELVQNAGIAMYQIKGDRLNSYHFFTEELHKKLLEKATLSNDLRSAIEDKQLLLYYQPQVDTQNGKMIGVEALVRWKHPELGMVSPAAFIPIAEETGLIEPIGRWVLETACQQAKDWQDQGYPPLQISVNISPREFRQLSFVEQVKKALAKSGLPAKYVNLEITESMMTDVYHCRLMLQNLRAIGVEVSVDDFGTGYSSLSYLNSFPLTHLKIDQTFIRELQADNRAIVKTIINLANNLQLQVVAEGVETVEQARLLKDLSCFVVQGFYYAKPLPPQEIEPLFTTVFT